MPAETTIPVLPCASLAETIEFYGRLGFTVTHKQSAPYLYLALRRGDAHLHFHGLAGVADLDRPKAVGTCLWLVPDVAALHGEFAAALRAAHGKLPIRGIPRISRFRPGQSRFMLVDPTGNSVVVIRHDEPTKQPARSDEPLSRLARALRQSFHLRDFKTDDAAAAAVLDRALARDDGPPLDRARALLARAELALALGDPSLADRARAEVAALNLDADALARLQPDLDALAAHQ
jgi:catechol 2,3-dioxygenase-like lactoylglutathione lyase family enzyme